VRTSPRASLSRPRKGNLCISGMEGQLNVLIATIGKVM